MEINETQYEQISSCFPRHRKRAGISNLQVLNACIYVLNNGCKWRALPKEYGNWHTIYTRLARWAKNGVLQNVFWLLQEKGIIAVDVSIVSLDSTIIKMHQDGMGALKKLVYSPSESHREAGTQKFIWLPYPIGAQ
jgi:transposase